MIPVKIIPTIIPMKRFVVKISRIRRSLAPATFSFRIKTVPDLQPLSILFQSSFLIPQSLLILLRKTKIIIFKFNLTINNPKYILRDRIKTCNGYFTFLLRFFTFFYSIYAFRPSAISRSSCFLSSSKDPNLRSGRRKLFSATSIS